VARVVGETHRNLWASGFRRRCHRASDPVTSPIELAGRSCFTRVTATSGGRPGRTAFHAGRLPAPKDERPRADVCWRPHTERVALWLVVETIEATLRGLG